MSIEIKNTKDTNKPSLVMCIYGFGKSGKTTLATTAPKPIIFDGENGTKGLKIANINIPVIQIRSWKDVTDAWLLVKDSFDYETIVVDPLGAFFEMLLDYVRGTGEMNLYKWGQAKDKFRKFVNALSLSGKHIIFIAHDTLTQDDQTQLRSVKIPANLSEDFHNAMDVTGYLSVEANGMRQLLLQPTAKIKAGTRYPVFPPVIENANLTEMIKTIHSKYEIPASSPVIKKEINDNV